MKEMIIRERKEDGTRLAGKTGLALKNRSALEHGWFVGYVEKGEEVFYFATCLKAKEGLTASEFMPLRVEVTEKVQAKLGIW